MNTIMIPKYELRAFVNLSKGGPSNSNLGYTQRIDNGCLLCRVSGSLVILQHTNRIWFVQRSSWEWSHDATDGHYVLDIEKLRSLDYRKPSEPVTIDLEGLRHERVASDYLHDLDFSNLTSRNSKGRECVSASYDTGLIKAVTRYLADARQDLFRMDFPKKAFEPLQLEANSGAVGALIMPVRS